MLGEVPIGGIGDIPLAPITFGISLVATIISAIFGIGGGGDVKQLANQVQQFEGAVNQALDLIKRAWWALANALGALLQAFHDALVGLIHAIWDELKKLVSMLGKLITEGLAKVTQAIRVLRQVLNDVYRNYIRPVLQWLQYVRRFLAILQALHVPFAAKLDSILVKIEGRIIAPYLYVLRSINGVANWVNLIVNARGLIQRAVFINTMYAYQSDWVNMWYLGQSAAGRGGSPPTPLQSPPPRTESQVQSDFQAFVAAGVGTVAQQGEQALAQIQATLQRCPA